MKIEGHRPLTEIIDSLLIKHSDSIDAIDEAYLNKIAYDYLKTLGNNVCLTKYAYIHVKDNMNLILLILLQFPQNNYYEKFHRLNLN